MPSLSAVFLVMALVLGVVIGPQTRSWSWGPAMIALGMAVATAIPVLWRSSRPSVTLWTLVVGILTAAWFGWRAWDSPVKELGQADLLLLAATVATFLSIRAIAGNALAEKILIWGIALLLLANVVVVCKQVLDPAYSPLFRARSDVFPSGFYSHYNEAANYLIASSLLVAAAAVFGKWNLLSRLLLGVIAVAGLGAIYFTHSRGGILGAAVGGGVFAVASLVTAKRLSVRWFAPALIAVPIVGLVISGFVYSGWQKAQAVRQISAKDGLIEGVMDNSRLHFLGIALSCIGEHPLTGGGSRSYSWECFQFSEAKNIGNAARARPEFVHNELAQTATDYGILGMGFLVLLLGTSMIGRIVHLSFSQIHHESAAAAAFSIGGLAALAGMFVQSCFSFVFHLLPGVILLGLCLGQLACFASGSTSRVRRLGTSAVLSGAAILGLVFMMPLGWKGVQLTQILWPVYFGKGPSVLGESKITAFTEAIRIWPQQKFYEERAMELQKSLPTAEPENVKELTSRVLHGLEKASELNARDPGPVINRANLLSRLEQDTEAENAYTRAIALEGGMEPAFLSHFSFATHLHRKSSRQFSSANPTQMLASAESAADQMEKSVQKMHGLYDIMYEPRVAIHESLGVAREANGDYAGAMKAYDFAAGLHYGLRGHYRAGALHRKMGSAAWTDRRPGEALGHFLEAKDRTLQAANHFPAGVTQTDQTGIIQYLDEAITYLKGAKVEPVIPEK